LGELTPMMKQYLSFKEQHPDKIIFFQVGDFFEIFFEDAVVAARAMDVVLTTRDSNKRNPIPLAGVPIHAADTYLNKLLGQGFKVALCEQVGETAAQGGLVRREITQILTPGTVTDPQMLEESKNNYLAVISSLPGGTGGYYGLAAVDVSTGDFRINEWSGEDALPLLGDSLLQLQPAESICCSPEAAQQLRPYLEPQGLSAAPYEFSAGTPRVKKILEKQWGETLWEELSLSRYPAATAAAAAALEYLKGLQHPARGKHFRNLELSLAGGWMPVDGITARNLELTRTLREGKRKGSLLDMLDHCLTAMGRRLLCRWVEQPLLEKNLIEERLEAVEELRLDPLLRGKVRDELKHLLDLERFCSRLCSGRVNARDLVGLKETLERIAPLARLLDSCRAALLQSLRQLPDFSAITGRIAAVLVDDPPAQLREGGLIRDGCNEEVDRLRSITSDGRGWLLQFEKKERHRTGIKSLRVGYNRNFGYYIEVTRPNLELVPPDYTRRQTLVNAERFITGPLKEMEEQITGAREQLIQLEFELFEALREEVITEVPLLQAAAVQLSRLDCLQSMAEAAERYRYCRPRFSEKGEIRIKKGRHPVVERNPGERFVPNDLTMDDKSSVLIITGPNMAGKSTYIRSAALIGLMAQIGSFVPAEKAELPLFDRIFARVGASDDLSRGLSTFMVEMQETASILKEATSRSLLVLDEIGRGTSTYDGMSIARSVLEYIGRRIGAKTLFSTHYHELTNLEEELPGVKNYTMAVREKGKDVLFLRRVVAGRSDKSYGVNVARLAGLPAEVLLRAEAILAKLETAASRDRVRQLSLLPFVPERPQEDGSAGKILGKLEELDLNRLTPLEALQHLHELQQLLFEDDGANSEGED
jgi:DNA mismatch repair protein MutS